MSTPGQSGIEGGSIENVAGDDLASFIEPSGGRFGVSGQATDVPSLLGQPLREQPADVSGRAGDQQHRSGRYP